jgi:hypothetical protein
MSPIDLAKPEKINPWASALCVQGIVYLFLFVWTGYGQDDLGIFCFEDDPGTFHANTVDEVSPLRRRVTAPAKRDFPVYQHGGEFFSLSARPPQDERPLWLVADFQEPGQF